MGFGIQKSSPNHLRTNTIIYYRLHSSHFLWAAAGYIVWISRHQGYSCDLRTWKVWQNSINNQKEHSSAKTISRDDVIEWKYFPRYWQFVRVILRTPVNSPHKGQWRGALMFSLICAWMNGWVNNREAGNLRRHCTHYDVTVMWYCSLILPLMCITCQATCIRFTLCCALIWFVTLRRVSVWEKEPANYREWCGLRTPGLSLTLFAELL